MDIYNKNNWIIIGVVVIVLILAGWLLMRGGSHSPVVGDVNATSTATSSDTVADATQKTGIVGTSNEGESISVDSQDAGLSVAVASMHLTRPSWVAIKDANGWILGAGWFAANATSGTVPLLRGTTPGQTYTALIYVDNGDKAFDFHIDALVDGVSATFTTNAAASSTSAQ